LGRPGDVPHVACALKELSAPAERRTYIDPTVETSFLVALGPVLRALVAGPADPGDSRGG